MPDLIIKIMRTGNNSPIGVSKDLAVTEWNNNSLQIITSRNISKSTPKPYMGLGYKKNGEYDYIHESAAIRVLFPDILSIDFGGDRVNEFRSAVVQWYESISMSVEGGGAEFNIGLRINNKAEMTAENYPISVMDYIKYKALFENDPRTAENKTDGERNGHYWFYKFNQSEDKKRQLMIAERFSEANGYYNELKDSSNTVKVFLTELKLIISDSKIDGNISNNLTLHGYIRENPDKFIELYEIYIQSKEKFVKRMSLNKFIESNMIAKTSYGGYIDVLSSKELALSLEEMLNFMVAKENKETMDNYRIRYLEKNGI